MPVRSIGKAQEVITARTYQKLLEYIGAFAGGHLNLLILIGNPGLAKTCIVQEALEPYESCWIEGNATAFGIYQQLYCERECGFVVIDDVDSLYSNRIGVRLLKGLCQTEEIKTVAWHSSSQSLKRERVPPRFTTQARVVIISNDWRTLNRNVVALQDRGFVLVFDPTAEEVHRQAGRWFAEGEPAVYEWFREHLHIIRQPSMRHYVRAAMLKNAGLDWTEVLLLEIENPRERLVCELQGEGRFPTQEARSREFIQRGGGSRRTYFNYVKRLRNRM